MANGAVAAVKKGCQLYKDIKNAAGDVSAVLKDIDAQFSGKKVTKEQAKKIEEKKAEVKAVATTDPTDVITQVANSLNDFFTAYDQIEDLFYAEENNANVVYEGDESVSKRALRRVVIRLQLEDMEQKMRNLMIYESPPEMKDIYTRFEAMREQISWEQKQARREKLRLDQIEYWEREMMKRYFKDQAIWLLGVLAVVVAMGLLMWSIKLHRENSLVLWFG
jgi:anion-transporting  ArsA/GET3 family ATPase